jgi:hypothetical protein
MSVILFEPQKFERVYAALREFQDDVAYDLTKYYGLVREPFNYDQHHQIYDVARTRFALDLANHNARAYYARYGEYHNPVAYELGDTAKPPDIFQLIKDLESLHYNSIESGDRPFLTLVTLVIGSLALSVVRKEPKYEEAEWI